ncbi:MAG: hypothetical protein U5L45_18710 [Saprospiraceae bacterium]|nr:hypothetical protein [Saprospiraceae bacterium]
MQRYLTSLFVIVPFFLFSQQNTVFNASAIDPRLYAVFGSGYIEESLKNDLFSLERWTFYLDNAYIIVNEPPTKDGSEGDFPTVRIPDLARVNILQLEKEQELKRNYYEESIYRIEGTTKYLVYHSGRNFIEAFNAFRRQLTVKN